jgi:hypothetical protein
VAIFGLQEVHNKTVCGKTLHEGILGLCEIFKVEFEALLERKWLLKFVFDMFLKLIEGDGILYHLNDPAIRAHRQYFVGSE